MGVDRQEINNSAKATSNKMVRGVAGLSNIARRGRQLARSQGPCPSQEEMSEFQTYKHGTKVVIDTI